MYEDFPLSELGEELTLVVADSNCSLILNVMLAISEVAYHKYFLSSALFSLVLPLILLQFACREVCVQKNVHVEIVFL